MSGFTWRGREFHFTVAAVVMGMMGVYLAPPPVEGQPDETALAVDDLLGSELDSWLEGLGPMGPWPGPEQAGELAGD